MSRWRGPWLGEWLGEWEGADGVAEVDDQAISSYGRPAHRVRRGPPRRWDLEQDDELLLPPVPRLSPDDSLVMLRPAYAPRARRDRTVEELLLLGV